MGKQDVFRQVLSLPAEDQWEVAEALWARLEFAVPSTLPEWQRKLLDERIAADDAAPDAGSPWEEVKERILASL